MSQPVMLQDEWTRMIQDLPRDQLPKDAAWLMQDLIPNLGTTPGGSYQGRLSRRSGWLYTCEDVTTDLTGATEITSAGWFGTFLRLCFTTDNNKFGYFVPSTAQTANVTQVSTSSVSSTVGQNYVELGSKLIITAGDGTTSPKYYDGTTFGALAGSPPAGRTACVWKDRLVLGNSSGNSNRSWFSALDDPTTWDTTVGWVNTIRPVIGYAALSNALLIFHLDATSRIRGAIPPPGSDFVVDDPLFNVGCHFPRTIAVLADNAFFANYQGVYLTNGTSLPQDLTAICGVKNLWQREVLGNTRVTEVSIGSPVDTVAGGIMGNRYFVTLCDALNNDTRTFVFDLANRSCYLFTKTGQSTNVMVHVTLGDELFFVHGTRFASMSSMFVSGGAKEDANGNDVQPVLVTRYFTDNNSHKKSWKALYLDYQLIDSASDNPTLTVSRDDTEYDYEVTSPVSLGTVSETTEANHAPRKRLPIGFKSRGLGFQIAQTNASKMTNIIGLSADVHALESSRR